MAASLGSNAALPVNNPQPRLPPEICERIIDHLDPYPLKWNDDRQTLLNCALVCRGWYSESRAVLFEEPSLRTRRGAMAFARSLTQMPLLDARVRRLEIGYSTTVLELASILVMLAGKLPKLASLSVYRVSFEHMRSLAFWSLHEFSHLTSLELEYVTLPSASPFFQVISSFPQLQSLTCCNLHWSKPTSMAPLPERHHMPLTTVTSLEYDLSCFEGIGHILLSLLDQAMLETLRLRSPVSAAALAFTQGMLNIAGKSLEKAEIGFRALRPGDTDDNVQSLLLHPISFEANVNLQALQLGIDTMKMNDVELFVQTVLLPLLNTISSKDLKEIKFIISRGDEWETDALLNAFDPEVCTQIDELLAEGHFPKLRDVSIDIELLNLDLDDSQHVEFCTEICARFPKLIDMNMLIIYYNGCQFPSYAERALKAKQLANKQPHPIEQAAA
ncbi:uncharacterized protein LAESUDRAFT_729666 [Laetiporus sulphureus 93-53]|uniref:F-box domain-containing protein n=1 Tax=Laetiporus sulphureus 93-53 TaxID=1314785 RepID=A0A165CIV5_9APHY|nr:uncharacterized protein LAESUDRAFT_729666 [Laetiporus sulphureus 93-53]KZT02890.1 hypothetical protein LAESUDRAFT_729666 [Laetiporus sulphureus 93-53]